MKICAYFLVIIITAEEVFWWLLECSQKHYPNSYKQMKRSSQSYDFWITAYSCEHTFPVKSDKQANTNSGTAEKLISYLSCHVSSSLDYHVIESEPAWHPLLYLWGMCCVVKLSSLLPPLNLFCSPPFNNSGLPLTSLSRGILQAAGGPRPTVTSNDSQLGSRP